MAIRGFGNEAGQNDIAQPSVAFHVDGVFVASQIALNQDFLDVDRIEVLRGPQGTVFGQNATGGTINVVSNQPKLGEFEGWADLQLGTFDLVRPRGVINIPVGDDMAFRAAFQYLNHEGFSENFAIPGTELDEANNFSGRLQYLWQVSDNLDITLRGQFFSIDTNDRAQKNILDPSPGRDLRHDFLGKFEFQSQMYNAEVNWRVPHANIKYIASYQDDEEDQSRDTDRSDGFFTPADIVPDRGRNVETITHEINITSRGEQALPLDWIVGGFYMDQETKPVRFIEFVDFNGDGEVNLDPQGPELSFQTESRPERESWSIYGQATFHFTDSLRFTGGIRYTEDDVNSEVCNFFCATPLVVATSDNEVTGRAGLEFDAMQDVMFYGGWSRGFKPGGSNLTFGNLVGQTFESESVDAFEAGIKSRFLDDRVTLNLAGYWMDHENFQFQNTDPIPFAGGVDNLSEVTSYGFEAELSANVRHNLRLDAHVAYNKAEITGDTLALDNVAAEQTTSALLGQGFGLFSPQVIAGRAAEIQNVNGNAVPKAPEWAFNIVLTHTLPVKEHGVLTSSINYRYKDNFNFRVFSNSAVDVVPSYDVFNLFFKYEPNNADWWVEAQVRNLEDDDAINSKFTDVFGVGSTSVEFIPPRQFLFRAGYRF